MDKAERKLGKPCPDIPVLPPDISYCGCHQVAHLLLIHFGLGLVASASVSYTSGLVNIPGRLMTRQELYM